MRRMSLVLVVLSLGGCGSGAGGTDGQAEVPDGAMELRDAGTSQRDLPGLADLAKPADLAHPAPDLLIPCRSDADCSDPTRSRCDVGSGLCHPCSPIDDRCPADSFCQEKAGVFTCAPGCKTDPECQQKMGASGRCCDHACVDTTSSGAHCGGCGMACGAMQGCCAGACKSVDSDPRNCGGCGKVCSGINTVPACQGGACVPGACQMGFGDCNGQANDGCETPTDSDLMNCGACNRACAVAHATPLCAAGACVIAACDKGYRDCNGIVQDGCELSVDADPKNCGGCGAQCGKVPHGNSGTCKSGQCVIDSCDPGFLDCNKMGADGCETDPLTSARNCGACGKVCPPLANAAVACAAGMCKLDKCNGGFADCDGQQANGCEASLGSDSANCGGCGKACGKGLGCNGGVCVPVQPHWNQQFPGRLPTARMNSAMAYDASRQVVVLFGGTNWAATEFADTWEWDGNLWTQKFPLKSPPGRDGQAMVYDEARKVVVLFGGSYAAACQANYNDTWEYDGVTWTQIQTKTVPAIRCYPYAAYDAARQVTVMFGGAACQTYNDTWEYDGIDWKQAQTAHAPTPRLVGEMAYDRGLKVATIYGGYDGFNFRPTDTWQYDGKDWTQLFPKNIPGGRTANHLAYHDLMGVSVLFGGYSGGAELGDTWHWDGVNWDKQNVNPAPLPRDGIAMAYDEARQQIVMFGGNNLGVVTNDTWVYGP